MALRALILALFISYGCTSMSLELPLFAHGYWAGECITTKFDEGGSVLSHLEKPSMLNPKIFEKLCNHSGAILSQDRSTAIGDFHSLCTLNGNRLTAEKKDDRGVLLMEDVFELDGQVLKRTWKWFYQDGPPQYQSTCRYEPTPIS